jgi:hypothetical protein
MFQGHLDDLSTPLRDPTRQPHVIEPCSSHMYQSLNILTTGSDQSPYRSRRPRSNLNTFRFATMLNTSSFQHARQMALYGHQLHDPIYSARAQQQYYSSQLSMPQPAQYQVDIRLRSLHEQIEPPCARMDHRAYSMNQPSFSIVDMRSSLQQFPMGYDAPSSYADPGKIRRSRVARILR